MFNSLENQQKMKRARDPNDTSVVNKIGKTEDAKGN